MKFALYAAVTVCMFAKLSLAEEGEHQGLPVFLWPAKIAKKTSLEIRKQRLAEEIQHYSRLAGSMRTVRRDTNDPFWKHREVRLLGLRRSTCGVVQDLLVNSYFDEPLSGFYQYGNCGEGAVVTICLAKHFGFAKKDVLHAQNRYKRRNLVEIPRVKHQFGLLRMEDGTWGLLDRWNRFQSDLRLEPIMKDGRHAKAPLDPTRRLYRLTTPKGGTFFAGPRVSEEIECRPPSHW